MLSLRDLEHKSIRAFVQAAADDGYLSGSVLDLGSGKQPYRDIVEGAGSAYTPYDAPSFPGATTHEDTTGGVFGETFDAVLCTQVLQYVPDPEHFLRDLRSRFRRADVLGDIPPTCFLVMTYPTHWPEVEAEDLHRFTKAGMNRLLWAAGYEEIVRHDAREFVQLGGVYGQERVALGYGVIARA